MTAPSVDSLNTYGGALVDYGSGVEDPTTDRPAASANQAYASTAAMTHTAIRAWARITLSATVPTVLVHDSMWGSSLGVIPTLVRNSTGYVTITWPTSTTDELGVAHPTSIRACLAPNLEGASVADGTLTPVTANTADLRLYNSTTGAAADFAGSVVFVAWL